MNSEIVVSKVVSKIYSFDFSKCPISDGNEFIIENGISDFVSTLKYQDLNKGIIVMPINYQRGLVYRSTNGGELQCPAKWVPDIVSFGLNILGLKKNALYRISIVGRSTGSDNTITSNRKVVVTTSDQDVIVDLDLTDKNTNATYPAIFRATNTELTLGFVIGKVFITNILIDEVEVADILEGKESNDVDVLDAGKIQPVAYGVFSPYAVFGENIKTRYIPLTRFSGKGINLYYDRTTSEYVIERDNSEDVIGTSFMKSNYIVDINLNKLVSKGYFNRYMVTDAKSDISPNTLKSGYLKFELVDVGGKPVPMKESETQGQIIIIISRIY